MIKEKRGIDFVRNLIKGKIAEIIFQHMFAEEDFATVLPFGYESITPQLAQYQHLIESRDDLSLIRNIPDFLLIKPDNTQIAFVQVKYRKRKDTDRVLSLAKSLQRQWPTGWLFLATLDGFFFEPCAAIIADKGDIAPLRTQWISKDIQEKYLALLQEFEH